MKYIVMIAVAISLQLVIRWNAEAAEMKRWNPGHYLTLAEYETVDRTVQEIEKFSQPEYRNIKGVKIKLHWDDFQSQPGTYDWEKFDRYIDAVPEGKQLFVLTLNRDFQKACNSGARLPDYIINHPRYPAVELINVDGCVAQFWQEEIMDEYIGLITAIGERYDANPKFGGLMIEETATNVDYSAWADTRLAFNNLMFEQLVRMHQIGGQAYQQAFLLQKINFLVGDHPDYEGERGQCGLLIPLTEVIMHEGGGVTNPDSVPWRFVAEEDPCRSLPAYEIYRTYKGQLPIMVGNDTSQLGDPNNENGRRESYNGKVMTMDNLVEAIYLGSVPGFEYEDGSWVEGFGANYIFWNGSFWSKDGGAQSGYREAILDFVNQPGHETVQDCPSNIECRFLDGEVPSPAPTSEVSPEPTTEPIENGWVGVLEWLERFRNNWKAGLVE